MSQRTYSEKEIAEIMRRAAEMESGQLREMNAAGELPGLNIDELSEIAAEAGLDPEHVRQAARGLDSPAENQQAVTSKNEIFAEKWADAELTDELAELVIADLNHRFNTTHQRQNWRDNILDEGPDETTGRSHVRHTGKSIEWKTIDENEAVEVRALIQPVKGKVRIRASKKDVKGSGTVKAANGAVGYVSYIPYLAALVVLFSLPYSLLVNLIAAILVFSILQLTLVPGAKKLSERLNQSGATGREKRNSLYKREVEQLTDELAALIGGSTDEAVGPGRIGLPDPGGEEKGTGRRAQGSGNKERS